MKKSIICGIVSGTMLMSSIAVGAMTTNVCGSLTTKNPLYSAPKGYAYTMGFKNITAKCTATKDGKSNTQSVSKNAGSNGSTVETDWVSGPTYSSSGTKFKSEHTGYSNKGVYQTLYASRSY